MNINSISVLLGFTGLAIGGIGLLAKEVDRPPADAGAVQSARSAWPPHALAAGVEFNDEMIELLTLGANPRPRAAAPAREPQAVSPEADTRIRSIRMLRSGGSRHAQFAEIEFVDRDGRVHRHRYPVGRDIYAAGDERDLQADQSALEASGYAPRRSRRSSRGHYRRWW